MNDNAIIYKPDEAGDKQMVFDLITSMYGGIALMMRAQQRTLDKDVLDLADKLESSHTKLTEELKMYASGKGWIIPAGELDADVSNREMMAQLDNETYQKQWLEALLDRHQTNVNKLENAEPYDSRLKSMAEKGASKLKDYISEIMDVETKVS